MSKLSIKAENTSYSARLIKLPVLRKHVNADRLQCVAILGSNVITGLNAKENDLYVFFPLECSINVEYLAHSDSLDKPELNRNKTKGFFSPKHGRVKAISLRGEKSEGYIVPVSTIEDWSGYKFKEDDLNKDFDHIGNTMLCTKYINGEILRNLERAASQERNKNKKAKRESKLVENQFRVAEDTDNLKRNCFKIKPEDTITISYKIHGANMSIGNVLCKKTLKWYEKILKKLKVNISDTHYDLIYASRRIIKNCYADKTNNSFYDVDIWGLMAEKYKGAIKDNVVLYGEVYGQLPNGKWIQKNYDYGLAANTADFIVYRGTIINNKGEVFEMSTPQLTSYCMKMGLKMVPVFYYGKAKDWDVSIELNEHWHEHFLVKMQAKYNEKDCYMCKNVVPEEGICLIKEGDFFEGYKLKSFKFLKRESDELDAGEQNIEDVESAKPNITT